MITIFFLLAFTAKADINVELNFFWSHRCPHCLDAKPFVQRMAEKYDWLQVNSYDLLESSANVKRYISMAEKLKQKANAVPGFIFCNQMIIGFDDAAHIGKDLEESLLACHYSAAQKAENSFMEIPVFGEIDARNYSLPILTLLIASLDAFNPCAFFVLLFLLSLMTHGQNRIRIAVIGGVFVLCSGSMYFLFMTAWLNLFKLTDELNMITALAGILALVIGAINIKDFYFFKQGISLSIPDSVKPKLFERIRQLTRIGQWPAMLMATSILAVAANSYELLCTAGLPMVYTRILTLNDLPDKIYYFYLLLYNFIYVVPLMLIVILCTWTLGGYKLSEKQGRFLKLISGTMMFGLGGMLFFRPELLNNMLASFSILGSTIIIALFLNYLESRRSIKIK